MLCSEEKRALTFSQSVSQSLAVTAIANVNKDSRGKQKQQQIRKKQPRIKELLNTVAKNRKNYRSKSSSSSASLNCKLGKIKREKTERIKFLSFSDSLSYRYIRSEKNWD